MLIKKVFIFAAFFLPFTRSCMIIAAGKKATIDGSVYVSHTDDAGGGTADLRLVRVPGRKHNEGDERSVYEFAGGYPRIVSNDRGKHYKPIGNQSLTKPVGYIDEIRKTYAYFDQDYGIMNEVQLSIAESTCSAKTVGWAKNLPYGYNLFGIAELSKIALERCDSARCAIQTMGDLAVEYGFYSEDSGNPASPGYADSAEALAIGDRYGELWIFHILTGPKNSSAVWAAQRVEDDHVVAVANGFIIREMDLSDSDRFMASDNVISFAEEMGWWNEEDGPFDFTAAYVQTEESPVGPLYTGRRVWRTYDLLAPSLELDSRLGFIPNMKTYPFSVKPDKLIDLKQITNVMRDYYQGSQYDLTLGVGAGPFGNPVRFDGPDYGINGAWERPISIYRAAYSFVLQIRGKLPSEMGGVMWYGQDAPHGTVFVPFYCSQERVPQSYLTGLQSRFNPRSAWWAFNFVNNWSHLRFSSMKEDIIGKYTMYHKEAIQMQKEIEMKVLANYHRQTKEEILEFLEEETNNFASYVVDGWWDLAWDLVSKYSGGYVTSGELPPDMKTPGYSKEWLQISEYSQWPGNSFLPPTANMESHLVTSNSFWNTLGFAGFVIVGTALIVIHRKYWVVRNGYANI